MPGSYCNYCDHRCFVSRTLPDDAVIWAGESIHMATCHKGMVTDRHRTGYDHTTAINPSTGRPGGTHEEERLRAQVARLEAEVLRLQEQAGYMAEDLMRAQQTPEQTAAHGAIEVV